MQYVGSMRGGAPVEAADPSPQQDIIIIIIIIIIIWIIIHGDCV